MRIDLGSSGCRIVAIDAAGKILAQNEAPLPQSVVKEGQVIEDLKAASLRVCWAVSICLYWWRLSH